MKKLINFFKDEEGATMVEYGLMVALIAVVCIAGATLHWHLPSTQSSLTFLPPSMPRPEANNRENKK